MAPYDPTVVVEAAFGYGWTDTPSWTDISAYVQSVSIQRGRSSEFDYFPAATCKLTLVDETRRFDPLNAAGPYFGNLKPNVPIRVRGLYNAVYYPRFYGFVDGWEQGYTDANTLTYVTVTATDATKMLANKRLAQSIYENTIVGDSPRLYWRLGEKTGDVAADISGNSNDGVYLSSPYSGAGSTRGVAPIVPAGDGALQMLQTVTLSGVMPAIASVQSASSTAQITSQPYSFEAWVQAPQTLPLPSGGVGASTTWTLWFQGDPSTAANRFWVIYKHTVAADGVTVVTELRAGNASASTSWTPTTRLDDGLPHHIVVTSSGGVQALYIDGASIPVGFTSTESIPATNAYVWVGHPTSFAGWVGVIDEVAWYPTALSSSQVTSHYSAALTPWDGDNTGTRIGRILDMIGWPAGLRSIDTGEAILAPANLAGRNAWDYMQSIAASEQGRLFISPDGKVTFHQADRFLTNSRENTSQWTFTDDGGLDGGMLAGTLRFTLTDNWVFNEAQVTRDGGVAQTASDSTSVSAYGPSTKTLSGLLLRDDSRARLIAERIVFRYKNPQDRADAWRMNPQVQPSSWGSLLNLGIGDRVTLEITPARTGSQIVKPMHLESIRDEITPEKWEIEFRGSPVDPNNYLVWGGNGATQGWGNGVWR